VPIGRGRGAPGPPLPHEPGGGSSRGAIEIIPKWPSSLHVKLAPLPSFRLSERMSQMSTTTPSNNMAVGDRDDNPKLPKAGGGGCIPSKSAGAGTGDKKSSSKQEESSYYKGRNISDVSTVANKSVATSAIMANIRSGHRSRQTGNNGKGEKHIASNSRRCATSEFVVAKACGYS